MALGPLPGRNGSPWIERDASAGASPRVLLVDDNEDGLIALDQLIKSTGFETMACTSGESAVASMERFRPDAILLDIGLPGMSGHEVARRVREFEWGGSCLLIAVTGFANEPARAAVSGNCFDHFEIKPLNINKLRRLLQQVARSGPGNAPDWSGEVPG